MLENKEMGTLRNAKYPKTKIYQLCTVPISYTVVLLCFFVVKLLQMIIMISNTLLTI